MFGRHLTGAGLSPLQTSVIKGGDGGGNLSLTAVGTNQATALLVTSSVNVVTTVTTTVNALQLPICDIGDYIEIANMTAKNCQVFGQTANGATGDTIQNGSANAAYTLNANKSAIFRRYSTTAWFVNQST